MTADVVFSITVGRQTFVVRKRHIGQRIYAAVEGVRDPLVSERVLLAAGLRRLTPTMVRDSLFLVVDTRRGRFRLGTKPALLQRGHELEGGRLRRRGIGDLGRALQPGGLRLLRARVHAPPHCAVVTEA